MPKTKRIDGKTYYYQGWFYSKREATAKAKAIRKASGLARVEKGRPYEGHIAYHVWSRNI